MPTPVFSLAIILVLILPGFLSYRFAIWRRVENVQRSPLWQMSEMLEHAVYVHTGGAVLVVLIHEMLRLTAGISSLAPLLLQEGPQYFLKTHFSATVSLFLLYLVYVVIASSAIGAFDIPGKITQGISKLIGRPTGPQETVWRYAFTEMSNGYRSALPNVYIRMKSGDVYYGEVASFPTVMDTEQEKDFLIRRAIYFRDGDPDKGARLFEADGIGAVLLNTANVDSIIIYYEGISTSAPA